MRLFAKRIRRIQCSARLSDMFEATFTGQEAPVFFPHHSVLPQVMDGYEEPTFVPMLGSVV